MNQPPLIIAGQGRDALDYGATLRVLAWLPLAVYGCALIAWPLLVLR